MAKKVKLSVSKELSPIWHRMGNIRERIERKENIAAKFLKIILKII